MKTRWTFSDYQMRLLVKCMPSTVLAREQEIGCMTRRWLFKVMSLHLGSHSCLEPLSTDVAKMVALMG